MTRALTLRLPDPLMAEAQAYAEGLGLSLNGLCAVALRDYLDARKNKPTGVPAKVPQPAAAPSPRKAPVRARVPSPPAQEPMVRPVRKVGPNAPCPCGSGKKYKKCHGMPGRA